MRTGFLCAAVAAFAPSLPAQDCIHQEQDSLVIVEFESIAPVGDWQLETSESGYVGEGYFRWAGPNLFNTPGVAVLSYQFEIHDPGVYNFRIRNYHDNPDQTESNDVWVRMDGGAWVKVFSSHVGYWGFPTTFDFGHDNQPAASYDLSAGVHTIEFSGRSNDFHMDRFHLFKWSNPDALNPSAPQSPCAGDEPSEPGEAFCFGDGTGNDCPCGNNSTVAGRGCVHSGGVGMTINGSGSTSITDDDLTLTIGDCPPGNSGLLFCGTLTVPGGSPLYDGLQCATGSTRRFAPLFQNDGTVEETGFVAQEGSGTYFVAGVTYLFQYWTRDSVDPTPCEADANLSPGYRVIMTP